MTRISADELRRSTLARQFPAIDARDGSAVLELFECLGPIQSQVPRAPFLTVASRLPGVPYQVVSDLFAAHHLLKASSIRGTVHTSTRADFVRLDAVCRRPRESVLRRVLRLDRAGPPTLDVAAVVTELESYASEDWRPRAELVDHMRVWLADRGSTVELDAMAGNLLWGHSGLIRRPKDSHWERRTDTFHRLASTVVELGPLPPPTIALAELVRTHLAAYGPLDRADLSFFFGVRLGDVDDAVAMLGDEVVRLVGPQSQPLLDLAEPPIDGWPEPGVRLLPEYDGLLVGYAGPNRTRFCGPDHLARVWAKVNGVFSPVVLADGRLVATWKAVTIRTTAAEGTRAGLEVTMLPGETMLGEDAFADQAAALGRVLSIEIAELRISSAR